jgi:hypothetical protein
VAAVNGITLDVAQREVPGAFSGPLTQEAMARIAATDMVIGLVAHNALYNPSVRAEVIYATSLGKPVLLLVEEGVNLGALPRNIRAVLFNRQNPFLVKVVKALYGQQQPQQQPTVLNLAAIAIGLLGLRALLEDEDSAPPPPTYPSPAPKKRRKRKK